MPDLSDTSGVPSGVRPPRILPHLFRKFVGIIRVLYLILLPFVPSILISKGGAYHVYSYSKLVVFYISLSLL
jgi:hypothetical protein